MTSSAYQYLSDDGTVYQTMLDDDFAGVLGYVHASSSEPYLPSYISMRYAAYKSSTGILLNAVYITFPFTATNPPGFFELDGQSYFYASSYGEQRGFSQNPTIVTIAGPPGPPSGGGGGGVTSITAGSGISVNTPTGGVTITNTGVLSFAPSFTSTNLSINPGGVSTVAHGLGRKPYFTQMEFVCATAEHGYSVGDSVILQSLGAYVTNSSSDVTEPAVTLVTDATNLTVIYYSTGYFTGMQPKTGGGQVNFTAANWNVVVKAW